ncbi:hypothetical protein OPT61_g484 [Boeremia exigua]|uniref:Uncharacterized protein n=1 Tax=Boeremia exigua TaxID=749465 RepID=A0ACC2ITU3_9PLEO|nr:hypothetical protein OPT61_g484 [Boeremia exigua]
MSGKSRKAKKRGNHGQQLPPKPSYYKYTPLQTSKSIRLLQLKPGKDDEPINCWLFEVRLDDWPSYQALSYTWGDPDDKSTIPCNEKIVSIPRNLSEGLRVLRRPDRLRILWADAVCINQKDPEERGSQVQLMSRIFSEASRVLIWLGHDDSSVIHAAFRYICSLLNRKEDSVFANYKWQGKEVDLRTGGTVSTDDVLDKTTIVALEHLFARSYFRRGWIVQEVVLPKTAEIIWDQACINYLWFQAATSDLFAHHLREFSDSALYGLLAVDRIRSFRFKLHDTPGEYAFARVLMLFNNQEFGDPRDHIYGLLGLQKICRDMNLKRPLFQPNYTISYLECYKSAAETLLIEHQDMGIISLVQHLGAAIDNSPSWVPRLEVRMGHFLGFFYYRWRACGYYRVVASKHKLDKLDCMRLRGVRVATLEAITPRGYRDSEEVKTLLCSLQDRHDERSIAWTMTHGMGADGDSLCQQPQKQERHMDDYRAFINNDVNNPELESAKTFGELCTECLDPCILFETCSNLLGLCSGPAQPGDQLVIFYGGRMPFVLRPVGDPDACWKLVGQKRHKRRARRTHARDQHLPRSTETTQAQRRLSWLPYKQPRSRDRNTGPQRRLAEVVGMARLGPQSVGQELLRVPLRLLVLNPLALLPVRHDLKRQPEDKDSQAQDVRQIGSRRYRGAEARGRKRRARQAVDQNNGQRAQRHPRRLRKKGNVELRRRRADLVEPAILPVPLLQPNVVLHLTHTA